MFFCLHFSSQVNSRQWSSIKSSQEALNIDFRYIVRYADGRLLNNNNDNKDVCLSVRLYVRDKTPPREIDEYRHVIHGSKRNLSAMVLIYI